MIIFRPHCELLEDAMNQTKEFKDASEMKRWIAENWGGQLAVEDIVIDGKKSRDNRIGWMNERYVCIKRHGNEDYITKYGTPQCIGMCATKYPKSRYIDAAR